MIKHEIALGYHRLFTHRSFQARWPVRLFALLFGAGAFEGSVLTWAADHRRHHKFVDQEADPYDTSVCWRRCAIGNGASAPGVNRVLYWINGEVD